MTTLAERLFKFDEKGNILYQRIKPLPEDNTKRRIGGQQIMDRLPDRYINGCPAWDITFQKEGKQDVI